MEHHIFEGTLKSLETFAGQYAALFGVRDITGEHSALYVHVLPTMDSRAITPGAVSGIVAVPFLPRVYTDESYQQDVRMVGGKPRIGYVGVHTSHGPRFLHLTNGHIIEEAMPIIVRRDVLGKSVGIEDLASFLLAQRTLIERSVGPCNGFMKR